MDLRECARARYSEATHNLLSVRTSQVSICNCHDQWRFVRSESRSTVNLVCITSSRSSEGVQIGGVCSAAGVVGAWSGAHHGQGWVVFIYLHTLADMSVTHPRHF